MGGPKHSASDPRNDDHAYFQAIEEMFVGLRGAPLLLSPADWQVARRWHRAGIPLELVRRTLEEVFARRRERGAKGRIQSLRYCAPAVEAAWEEIQELTAPGRRTEAPPLDVAARLAALARALPAEIPRREWFVEQLTSLSGESHEVEDRLARLDAELMKEAAAGLDEERRRELEEAVERTLQPLAGRLPRPELAMARERLFRQHLRRRLGLPVLSLFAPEAEEHGGEGATGPQPDPSERGGEPEF